MSNNGYERLRQIPKFDENQKNIQTWWKKPAEFESFAKIGDAYSTKKWVRHLKRETTFEGTKLASNILRKRLEQKLQNECGSIL